MGGQWALRGQVNFRFTSRLRIVTSETNLLHLRHALAQSCRFFTVVVVNYTVGSIKMQRILNYHILAGQSSALPKADRVLYRLLSKFYLHFFLHAIVLNLMTSHSPVLFQMWQTNIIKRSAFTIWAIMKEIRIQTAISVILT